MSLAPTTYLIFSVATLWLGPALTSLFKTNHQARDFLDGFIVIAIAGLVFLYILPHTVADAGITTLLAALLGLLLPSFLEKIHKIATRAHKLTIVITVVGLAVHSYADGLVLLAGGMLAFAIVLHNIPVGFFIWWIARDSKDTGQVRKAVTALVLISLTTLLGFFSNTLLTTIQHNAFGYLEAFVAGSLLHVLFHEQKTPAHHHRWFTASGLGALAGIGIIATMGLLQKSPVLSLSLPIFFQFSLQTATALVLAYCFSGIIQSFFGELPAKWLTHRSTLWQSLKGMAFGLPIPICSCGVVPIYRSLVKQGVPLSAGIAFLIATPELGFDAFLISFPLLGKHLAITRLLTAATLAMLVALILGMVFKSSPTTINAMPSTTQKLSFKQRLKLGLHTGLEESVDHTFPWIAVGLAIAALVQPYMQDLTWLKAMPENWQVPLFALLGLPVYVCAAGVTPFVAVLVYNGVSPGAAIAFLLTGPATNITTFGVLKELHGKKLAMAFVVTMIILTTGLGHVVNAIPLTLPEGPATDHTHGAGYQLVFLTILATLYVFSLLRQGPRYLINQIIAFDARKKQDACCEEPG